MANARMTDGEIAKKARSILRDAVPAVLKVLSDTAANAKASRAQRLKATYVLIQCAEQGIWQISSQHSRATLSKISKSLLLMTADAKTKPRERLKAINYLLMGVDLGLWKIPSQFLSGR